MKLNSIYKGDCFDLVKKIDDASIDLIYMDPPFYTQRIHKLTDRYGDEFSFNDSWENINKYIEYIEVRLEACKKVLKDSGSIFLHCDRNASHYLKIALDRVFGEKNFQSEIIWCYKRWSNSKKGLLNNHQVIFFYSKTNKFKFNSIYTDYSDTTNIDQILQERVRDKNGKSKYKIDEDGNVVMGQAKKGVPLSDVWDIPFLNPKAKERVGYPTQKPIVLLEQIIKLVTAENDIVLDPFMGSGTTLVAAKLLGRRFIGFDISDDALMLAEKRLNTIVRTDSNLLKRGHKAYQNLDSKCLDIIKSIDAIPVQRNSGIDGFLREHVDGGAVAVRIQRDGETLNDTVNKLRKACKRKHCSYMVVIRTHNDDLEGLMNMEEYKDIIIIDSYDIQLYDAINNSRIIED
jgi:adenine-specific DNA methylase